MSERIDPHTANKLKGHFTDLRESIHQVLREKGIHNVSVHSIEFVPTPLGASSGPCPPGQHPESRGTPAGGTVIVCVPD